MAKIRVLLPAVLLIFLFCGLYTVFGRSGSDSLRSLAEYKKLYQDGKKSLASSMEQKGTTSRKPRYAITSSVQTSSFTPLALMLAYSIQKHNDLAAMDAELVLLVREDPKDGVTEQDKVRLKKAGWQIRAMEELTFNGVDNNAIRAHHRHNLNKLHLWKWTEYEKILFIDADVVCKGSLAEVWSMPGDFAASPDVWWDIPVDSRFNSGVIVFRPSRETFNDMIPKVSDPEYHKPNDADQAFLNAYFKYRFYMLPFKFNLNLIMYQWHRKAWDTLWNEAVFVHFTIHKPKPDPKDHCHKGCAEWEPLEWYGQFYKEMLEYHGWQSELPVIA